MGGPRHSLVDLLKRWTVLERKQVILNELSELGNDLEGLQNAVPPAGDFDVFDLVAHAARDQKPLTPRERANNLTKQNDFAKYGKKVRAVLDAVLDQSTNHRVPDIEDAKILELPPFDEFGTKTQNCRDIFEGTDGFSRDFSELENALYSTRAV
ncbi:MAG: hypothetical protein NT069_24620 [Planctomycetota bacterium]|nr:hypothetical protein [Planctomycetota bacterium]